MKHPINEPYAVQINVHELNTSGRRAEVARLILSGMRKPDIIDYLMETFGMEYKQAKSEYRQGYTYIYIQTECTKDEIRKLNLARLEELFDQAEEDERLEAKEYYKILLKNIDTVNKTAQIYDNEQKETQNMSGDFTITFNGGANSAEKKEDK